MRSITRLVSCGAALGLVAALGSHDAAAQGKKLVFATPGIPPIFAAVVVLVADQDGFFKKYGANVEVRPFDTGAAAARAVVAGDIDFALAPAVLTANQISNAGVDLVALWGMPNPDFVLGSTDPKKASCKDLVGQPVGVDSVGGQRSIMLKAMLGPCGVAIADVQQVSLGSNAGAAMIAGQLTFGVLHIDDLAVLEHQGKPVTTITTIKKADPMAYNILGVARRDRVAQDRDGFVRLLAGLTAAARAMKDTKNADRIAEIAAPTGRTKAEAKTAIADYIANDEWPTDDDGLDKVKLEALIADQVKNGGIQPGKTPVTYDRLVDRTLWRDAAALLAK
ncbi:MAG TPA: ABC transporter substrate-binding protein [Stellaceae bacterium]|nr:ABC transporter substrate-binding protein [Stellaceae bacterium]